MKSLLALLISLILVCGIFATDVPKASDFLSATSTAFAEIKAETLDSGFDKVLNETTDQMFRVVKTHKAVGIISVSSASYQIFENINASLQSKNLAYWRAFNDAKSILLAGLRGYSSQSTETILDIVDFADTESTSRINSALQSTTNIQNIVEGLLRGYAVYEVRDIQADEAGTIKIALVITPRTLESVNRVSEGLIVGKSLDEAIELVLDELNETVIPPVGGKVILVPGLEKPIMIAFGSEIVRYYDSPSLRSVGKNTAKQIAKSRALASLNSLLNGDKIILKQGYTNVSSLTANIDSTTFDSVSKYLSSYTSTAKGEIPAGTIVREYLSPTVETDDYGWALAIAFYTPNLVSDELLKMVEGATIEDMTRNDEVIKDDFDVPRGPSGIVTRPEDIF